jgi:hypothetical protein
VMGVSALKRRAEAMTTTGPLPPLLAFLLPTALLSEPPKSAARRDVALRQLEAPAPCGPRADITPNTTTLLLHDTSPLPPSPPLPRSPLLSPPTASPPEEVSVLGGTSPTTSPKQQPRAEDPSSPEIDDSGSSDSFLALPKQQLPALTHRG